MWQDWHLSPVRLANLGSARAEFDVNTAAMAKATRRVRFMGVLLESGKIYTGRPCNAIPLNLLHRFSIL
jgi:hypothetical protein